MSYIITGGSGFIGSHIVETLLNNNEQVIVIDNLATGRIENIQKFLQDPNFNYINGSITDFPLLKKLFTEDVGGIFHEAAIPSVQRSIENPIASNEANITGTLNVLVAARDAGVRKVVFAASSSAYGDTPTLPKIEMMPANPLSPYALTKYTCEQYCYLFSKLYGLQTACLRYFNVYGPRQNPESNYAAVIPKFITTILRNESPVIHGDGLTSRDFTFVNDVVQANLKAMQSDAQGVYNIAYGQGTTLNELAHMIMDITDNQVDIRYDDPRVGDVKHSLADITKAQSSFGYAPEYSIRKGLEVTIEWFKNQSRI